MQARPVPILLAAAAALAVPAQAQTGEVKLLLREGDALPGITGALIVNIDVPSTNSIGGWACGLDFDDMGNTIDLVWGTVDGFVPAGELFREGTYIGFEQVSWESSTGIADDGTVCYSPSSTEVGTGTTDLDGVWLDATIVAIEDMAIPSLPGKVFRFGSRPDVLPDGRAIYVAGINDEATGNVEGNGLFLGDNVLLKTGDTVPGVPGALDGNAVDFDFRFSPDGSQWISTVDDSTQASSADAYVVVNGVGLTLAGGAVGEDQPFPVSLGGDGIELWDNFDYFGILNDGTIAFTGDLDGPTTIDEFIFYGDAIALREGDTLPNGQTLTGSIEGFGISDNGGWAAIWDMTDGLVEREILLINGVLALAEGDAVDFDGDGTIDPGVTINNFASSNALSVAPDGTVYVVADLDLTDTGSNDLEVLLEVRLPALSSDRDTVSVGTNESANLLVAVPADVAADFYFLAGALTGTSPGFPIDGLTVPLNFDGYTNYTLTTVNGPALNPNFGGVDQFGLATVVSTPGLIAPPSAIGATISHAYVTIDTGGLFAVLSSVSNAAEFVLAP